VAEQSDVPVPIAVPVVEVRDLVVEFGGRRLLRRGEPTRAVAGVSLAIPAGTTVGVVGQSGSGKTTLGRTIVGLESRTSGEILIEGEPLLPTAASRSQLRRTVQMIFQDSLNSLNPRRTIGSTLGAPLAIHGIGDRADRPERIAELLRDVGLDPTFANRHPAQLSGGQRQRVNIARALASEPKLIIADEPTSALDVSVRAQILDLLLRLQAERGLSFLFISHDLHVVRHLSATVAVMHQGVFVEVADGETLYRDPRAEYTRQLLAATPMIDESLDRGDARRKIARAR
jgi:ABC-type glutathione transport system ATPase component